MRTGIEIQYEHGHMSRDTSMKWIKKMDYKHPNL